MLKFSIAALAGTALLASAPTMAKPGGSQGAGSAPPTTMGQPSTTDTRMQPTDTMTPPTTGRTTREQSRSNSQGPSNASPTGVSHANENSVLASGSVAADTLPGLTTGLNVQSSSGTSLGTISEVVTASDGSIRQIVVTTSTGQTVRLPASSLSISGNVVTTTSTSP